jgi:hypothetical protein
MSHVEQMRVRRAQVLHELARLEEIRRGSLTEQYVEAARLDGSRVRRGPYPLYTFKEKGRTMSRRLRSREEVERYRGQIEGFRRFRELVEELRRLGEGLSDAVSNTVAGSPEDAVKKTPWSRSRGTRKSRAS